MKSKLSLLILLGLFTLISCTTDLEPTEEPSPTSTVFNVPIEPIEIQTAYFADFDQFPTIYQYIQPPTYLAEKIDLQDAQIVGLPSTEEQPVLAEQVFQAQVDPIKYDPSLFSVERTVAYATVDYAYVAVPVAYEPDYNFSEGVMAGLLGDANGGYTGIPGSYEVWFFEEGVSLRDSSGEEVFYAIAGDPGSDFYWDFQETYIAEPIPYFIENGCWLCWSLDGRSGCLICK